MCFPMLGLVPCRLEPGLVFKQPGTASVCSGHSFHEIHSQNIVPYLVCRTVRRWGPGIAGNEVGGSSVVFVYIFMFA